MSTQSKLLAHLTDQLGFPCDAALRIDDHLLVTASTGEDHLIMLIDYESLELVAEQTFSVSQATAFMTRHPLDSIVLLELAMGQDGSHTLQVDISATHLQLTELFPGEDLVVAGFNSSGTALLLLPHPNDPETARVVHWPTLQEVGHLNAQAVGADLGFGLAGCWIDDQRVALYLMEDSIIVTDGVLSNPTRINLPLNLGDEADVESMRTIEAGVIEATIWTPAGRRRFALEFSRQTAGDYGLHGAAEL